MATYQPAKTGYYADLRELVRNNPDADLPTLQKLAAMGAYARQQEVSSDMYENPGQMLEDLQARQQKETTVVRQPNEPRRAAAPAPRQPVQMPAQQGSSGAMFNPYQQMSLHRGMASDVMGAIGDEMSSRVAQGREARRLGHEKEMMAARSDAELKLLIERLKHERYMAERQMQMMREMDDRKRGVMFSSEWSKPIPYR